ncbi:CU044_2847 family protein [Actinoplanes sp. NPDC049596]|uniref:CU044_2847 family protein n=1 Tax=unclassified Actinoplanes TaxID=2626549 RepID=UPI00343D2ABF
MDGRIRSRFSIILTLSNEEFFVATVLLRVPVEEDGSDCVEIEVDPRDVGADDVELTSADGRRTFRAARSLAGSVDRLLPAVESIITRVRRHGNAPDKVSVELGVKFAGETGVILTKGTAEATMKITMNWERAADGDRP